MHGEIFAAHAPEQLQHRHVAERCALLASAEQVSPGWLRLNDLDCLRRERYAMLLARFHAAGRDAPDRLLQVDLVPPTSCRRASEAFVRASARLTSRSDPRPISCDLACRVYRKIQLLLAVGLTCRYSPPPSQ